MTKLQCDYLGLSVFQDGNKFVNIAYTAIKSFYVHVKDVTHMLNLSQKTVVISH